MSKRRCSPTELSYLHPPRRLACRDSRIAPGEVDRVADLPVQRSGDRRSVVLGCTARHVAGVANRFNPIVRDRARDEQHAGEFRAVRQWSAPHSRNESGWGALHLPIVSIWNGAGPTVAFTGGNHGDEYEGPIALLKLVRALEPAQISDRVIVIPALNYPAVMGGTRVSPIDGVNMNRAFPGRRDGSVTRMIAHFVQHRVLPVCDALFDIHVGGR